MIRVALPFGRTPVGKRGPYREALESVGIQAVEDAASLAGLDGLLLAGGTDVGTALYGEEAAPQTQRADAERDRLEALMIREAVERDFPVLAICRGMQMLNVALGGTLTQHIEGHRDPERKDAHSIAIVPGSRLGEVLGAGLAVNSRHHQCAARVADGLVVTATAPDGVIEAVELPGKRFVLGVQWHPEDRMDREDARLFAAFGESIRKSG